MSPVNEEKIISLIAEVRKAHAQLESYAQQSHAGLLASSEKLNSLKYLFIVGIEACIGICQHVASKKFQEVPESYSRCFDILAAEGVVPASLALQVAELARFRNVLVHLYWKVDDARVLENLSKIRALDDFTRTIERYLGIGKTR